MKRVLSALAFCGAAAAGAVEPGDFAAGWPVEAPPDQALYLVELPYEVLAASRRDRADVAVFNAAGEAVPWWWAERETPPATEPVRLALPVYPDSRIRETAGGGREIVLRQDGGATELRVTPGAEQAGGGPGPAAWIVVVPEAAPPLDALELDWSGANESFVRRVEVAAGDDLIHWRAAGAGAIAALRAGGETVWRRRVPLSVSGSKYYRISGSGLPPGWRLDRVTGVAEGARPEPVLAWRSFTPREDAAGRLLIEPGARLEPRVLQLELAQTNTLVSAVVEGRLAGAERWRALGEGLFYRLRQNGETLQDSRLDLPAVPVDALRLTVTTGKASDIRAVALGWDPPRLVFVARGPGPYLLAAGSGRAPGPHSARPGAVPADIQAARATLGPRLELGGTGALQRPVDWKRVLLWGLLVSGAAAVLFMVWRLARRPQKH